MCLPRNSAVSKERWIPLRGNRSLHSTGFEYRSQNSVANQVLPCMQIQICWSRRLMNVDCCVDAEATGYQHDAHQQTRNPMDGLPEITFP